LRGICLAVSARMPIASDGNLLVGPSFLLVAATLCGGGLSVAVAAAMPAGSPKANRPIGSSVSQSRAFVNEDSGASSSGLMSSKENGALKTESPTESCLATTICEVKERLRRRTPAWTPSFCRVVAHAVLRAAERHRLPPALILAVMINESDLNENAASTTYRDGRVYAKDGGLMGIRCVLDKKGRCLNPNPHGILWQEVMSPQNNIALGARELAYWRDVGGVERIAQSWRDHAGVLHSRQRLVRCRHRDHAYWAHYNHGEIYLDHGNARHYPHRVAVLYYALLRAMNLDIKPLTSMALTVKDPGRPRRTADRPVELRYRKLCQSIRDSALHCGALATAHLGDSQ